MPGRPWKWTEDQVAQLLALYPDAPWEELMRMFHFSTRRGIKQKANQLGLVRAYRTLPLVHRRDFFSSWTPDSAYVLGFLEADGYFDRRRGGVAFTVTERDLDYLLRLKGVVGYTGRITTRIHRVGSRNYGSVSFTVVSKHWWKALIPILRVGRIPPTIPPALLHHYIRGYFDGNGSAYVERRTGYTRSNITFGVCRSLAEDFGDVLRPVVGSKLTLYRKTNSPSCLYVNLGKAPTVRLAEFMYRDAHVFLERKFRVLEPVFRPGGEVS